ncbi:MAG: ATP synthase F0 subunit B [Bacteroidetes bacterium GWA2_30_7]|nr:MAG: ATP synthase F0 subunit B [Bacteroidetes bacterium GWA2_30_7]
MELVQPGIGLIFWMLLSFTLLLIILRKFAWKPILKALKDRENSIENALQSAQKAKEQMEQLTSDNEKIINEAKKERDRLMKEAREVKEKIISDAKDQALIEAHKLTEASRQAIENEKAAAMTDIKNLVATLSIDIAEKIIRQTLENKEKQKELIQSLLKDVKLN